MLTQGSAPDPKCDLNITFLTLQHPLHCLICAKDIMIIVLLLQVMEGWEGWEMVHFCLDREWVSYFFYFFRFCAVNCSFMAGR